MAYKEFNYDQMVQKALRTVVYEALKETEKNGLPGSHHFYLTFQTNRSDVKIPDFLREKHPDEVTIVLQHQFWDLKVTEEYFEVSLSFNDLHEKIHIPFSALVSFLDPSAKFGLQFIPEAPKETGKEKDPKKDDKSKKAPQTGKVIALDIFRKK